MSLQTQAAAAKDGTFISMCEAAAVQTAQSIYTEATTLSDALASGTAITSIPITPALSASITAGTDVQVGADVFVASGTNNSGATSITVTSKAPAVNHVQGEAVTPPTPTAHTARAVLATNVVRAPDTYGPLFAWLCASQGDTNATADATILSHVSAVWNTIAGA